MSKKFEIVFNENYLDSIGYLKMATGKDLGGVICLAMGLLQRSIQEIGKGGKICVVKDGKIVKEITGIVPDESDEL